MTAIASERMTAAPGSGTARGMPRLDVETLCLIIGCALSTVMTLWLISGIWHAGVPTGDDTSAHVLRTQYALDHLFSRGELDGWQSSFGLGYQEFLFIGPLFTIGVTVLKVLSLGLLSTLDAFKAMIAISYCLIPISVAVLACAFGLGRRAAGVAAVLTVGVNSYAGGIGVDSVFHSGLVANQFGSVFFLLTLAGLVWLLRGPSPRRVLFAGLAFGALTMTHGIGAIIGVVVGTAIVLAAGIEWLLRNRRAVRETRRALRALALDDDPTTDPDALPVPLGRPIWIRVFGCVLAGALAFGLAAFVLIPVLVHGDLRGFNTGYPDTPLRQVLLQVWKGEFLYEPFVAIFVVLGLAVMAWGWKARPPMSLALVLTPFLYLLLAQFIVKTYPGTSVALQMTGRSYAYVAVICLLPLAGVIGAPQHHLGRTLEILGLRNHGVREIALGVAQILPLLFALVLVLAPNRLDGKDVTTTRPTAAIIGAAEALKQQVPDGARFVMQRAVSKEVPLTGMSHPDFWLPWASGRDTLNIYNVESSTVFGPVYEAEHLTDSPPDQEANKLASYGVTHVLLLDPSAAPGLVSSPFFEQTWAQDGMVILKVKPPGTGPDPASIMAVPAGVTAQVTLTRTDPEHLQFHIDTDRATTASIAVAYSPKWTITVNGVDQPTSKTSENLLSVSVPKGASDVTLTYGSDTYDFIGRTITLLTIIGLLAWGVSTWRRRRRPAASPSDAGSLDLAEAEHGEAAVVEAVDHDVAAPVGGPPLAREDEELLDRSSAAPREEV